MAEGGVGVFELSPRIHEVPNERFRLLGSLIAEMGQEMVRRLFRRSPVTRQLRHQFLVGGGKLELFFGNVGLLPVLDDLGLKVSSVIEGQFSHGEDFPLLETPLGRPSRDEPIRPLVGGFQCVNLRECLSNDHCDSFSF